GASISYESHTFIQYLIIHPEDAVVTWISEEEERGFAPSHTHIRQIAEEIIESSGSSVIIGK
ncbi:hypothetical protein C7212DRAFT_40514, partial [Tuber magnatum]